MNELSSAWLGKMGRETDVRLMPSWKTRQMQRRQRQVARMVGQAALTGLLLAVALWLMWGVR